jgi:predicted DNA-binding transcriptional regulator AlpA|tara:strand:- start:152 stop:346 length:195 start_codon:yes stop_codon:yes gene_type:complete
VSKENLEKRIYSGREIAKYCNMAYSTFFKYVKLGKLPKPLLNNAKLGWDITKINKRLDDLQKNS